MMKRTLILLFSCAVLFSARPAAAASETFEKMLANISAMGAVDMTVSMEGANVSVEFAGERYRVKSDFFKVWCDGKTQWVYFPDSKEMTVCEFDPESADLAVNPALILSEKVLTSYSVAQQSEKTVVLKAKSGVSVGYPQVEIDVNSSFMPRRVRVVSREGDSYEIAIVSLKKLADPSKISFAPSESLLKSALVNDMR